MATLLGFIIGIMRLSQNWLVSSIATLYIETIRNVPLLLQMFVWYGVVLKSLPGPRQAINISDMFFLSNRGLNMPDTIFGDSAWLGLAGLVAGIVGAIVLRSWARKRQAATGQPFPYVLTGIAMILVLPFLGLVVAGWPITFDYPVLGGFNFSGGTVIIPEFMALLVALSIYTASFIAEIVRAGIQAVSHGQTEAASALGMRQRHHHAAGGHSPGHAGDHSAARQPVPEPDKELFAGGGDRLSRSGGDRRHGLEPNRTGH